MVILIGLSKGGAEWIANHGGIHGVGIDTASLDFGQSKDFMAHRTLLKNQIFIMEYLNTNGLESFPMVKPYLIVTPLKITGGSGSPVRALLLSQLPKEESPNNNAINNHLLLTNIALQKEVHTCRQFLPNTRRIIVG